MPSRPPRSVPSEPVTPVLEADPPRSPRPGRSPLPEAPTWVSCPSCPDLARRLIKIETLLEVHGDNLRAGFERLEGRLDAFDERIRDTEQDAAKNSGEHRVLAQVADREPKWRSANVAMIAVLVTALLAGASLLVNLLKG